MTTKNLSHYTPENIPSAADMRLGIVIAEWNTEITSALAEGALSTLKKHGASDENILIKYVPGSFELPLGAQFFAEMENVDAVILLGCVIQGETKHFDYICTGVTKGTVDLNLKYNKPFIFGVLTTNTFEQAKDRSGGKHGNKGDEAAVSAIKMIHLKRSFVL
ncbi:MAG: 6,7-dimethyl-8-ribityllumazine synthase [Prolixibacteraceae bacterium]|nr:6,7-dimethyl-8-ribityllumazine synthase [Prolixibacteraceae bacterium]